MKIASKLEKVTRKGRKMGKKLKKIHSKQRKMISNKNFSLKL